MAVLHDIDLRVLGGLPITVAYVIGRAEPDVGIMSDGVDDWWITHVGGRPVKKKPLWLTRRLDAAKVDIGLLISESVDLSDVGVWED